MSRSNSAETVCVSNYLRNLAVG